jgi:hypothetical protein
MKTILLHLGFAGLAALPLLAKDAAPARPTWIEIESKFIEAPDAVVATLHSESDKSFMDKYPGKKLQPRGTRVEAVLGEKEAEKLLARLNAKKGVDICSAPRITTISNQRAVVEIIREFRYSNEWDAPTVTS